jgi:hypothetical protein
LVRVEYLVELAEFDEVLMAGLLVDGIVDDPFDEGLELAKLLQQHQEDDVDAE